MPQIKKLADGETVRYLAVRQIIEQSDLSVDWQRDACDQVLHYNWTKAASEPNYNKEAWMRLERLVWPK